MVIALEMTIEVQQSGKEREDEGKGDLPFRVSRYVHARWNHHRLDPIGAR